MMNFLTSSQQELNYVSGFAKYHGNGNDFIIIELSCDELLSASYDAVKLCDRNLGIGADGLILLAKNKEQLVMRVINRDGSFAKNCGNGLRCAARWYFDRNPSKEHLFIVFDERTFACKKTGELISVAMGLCCITPQDDLYFSSMGQSAQVFDAHLGNEHKILVFNQKCQSLDLLIEEAKAKIASWQHYNLGFLFPEGGHIASAYVYERGVGLTKSCGTNAAAAACSLAYGIESPSLELTINQPGGPLNVLASFHEKREAKASFSVTICGDAQAVFEGFWHQPYSLDRNEHECI